MLRLLLHAPLRFGKFENLFRFGYSLRSDGYWTCGVCLATLVFVLKCSFINYGS